MSDSSALPKSCPKCGADLPSEATEGLCPRCILSQALQSAAPKGPWQPPTAEELAKLLPQYEITRMLGRGGMGAVYQGTQKSLDRPVAIKILSAEMEDQDASFADRFKNEARSMAKLTHPGIVAVYDSGETADGMLYIVMEFIEGTDVARMIAKQKRLHTEHAMAITAHVCDALAYAHERGIIHRDIKPANIMVGYDGVVKIADFGLAKMSKSSESGLTQSGMAMGTLYYMAPEALTLGTAVDQRADIYAVGVMLYQMLTGKLPQGLFELPSLQVPGLDPRYDGIISKALREDRNLRYPRTQDMRHDLDAILTQPVVKVEADAEKAPAALNTQARPQRPGGQSHRPPQAKVAARVVKRSSPLPWVAVVLVIVAVGLATWFLFGRSQTAAIASASPPLPNPTAVETASKDQPFTNSLGMKFVPVPITGGPTGGKRVLFSVWETRVQDYEVFASETKLPWRKAEFAQGPTHPAVYVSWEEARAFCAWLTERERKSGGIDATKVYRLPLDHEWSCAVGIGDREDPARSPMEKCVGLTDIFPWGKAWPPPPGSGNYSGEESIVLGESKADIVSGYRDGFIATAPVGSFPSVHVGLHDLSGNTWEWCEDWYDATQKMRVLRGGSWHGDVRSNLLSSSRIRTLPAAHYYNHGFRCVIVSSAQSASSSPNLPVSPSSTAATKEQHFVNSLGMQFVPVPITGGPSSGKLVLFSVWDTRVQDYEVFAKETKHEWPKVDFEQGPTHPAVNVSWQDAKAFCAWLSKKEGRIYRLPLDAEWSAAVGLVSESGDTPADKNKNAAPVYPWGTQWPPPAGAGNYAGEEVTAPFPRPNWKVVSPGYNDGFPRTSPVGSFAPNRYGLYDMGGNVWQLCEDQLDPSVKNSRYVMRGASWDFDGGESRSRSASRAGAGSAIRFQHIGFRCVLSIDAPALSAKATPILPEKVLPPELAALDQQFIKLQAERVTGVFDADVAKLNTGYLGGLDREIVNEKSSKHLETVPALEAEKKLITARQPMPATDDSKVRPILKNLRSIYRDAFAKLEAARMANYKALTDPLVLRLKTLEADLTKQNRNADAKAVREYREKLPALDNTAAYTASDPFTNTLGMKFVPVPDTNVLFCIHETRYQDYAVYVAESADVNPDWKNQTHDGFAISDQTEERPVVDVSWDDAQAFCAWLSKKEGKIYRLPTDQEWSCAVGIGRDENWTKDTTPATVFKNQSEFPWGVTWPPPKDAGNYSDSSRKAKAKAPRADAPYLDNYDDGFPTTAPVMSFKPNKLGLYDMGGNAFEWVEDWYDTTKAERVLRGGSWGFQRRGDLLSSYRLHRQPNYRFYDGSGFRCVVEVSPGTSEPFQTHDRKIP